MIGFPSAAPHNLATSSACTPARQSSITISKKPQVWQTEWPYRVGLFGTNHNLLSIPHPPLILDGFCNPERDVSASDPTHPRRANRLGEEARRHHRSLGPPVVLHEQGWPDEGPAEASRLGGSPGRLESLLGDDFDEHVGGKAGSEDCLGEVGGKEVAAGGQVDEVFDGAATLDAGEEVHGGEKLVRAGQVKEDGVDAVGDELGFEPFGVLDGSFENGDFV